MVRISILILSVLLSLFLFAQDEYEAEWSFLSDSISDYLSDHSLFLTEEMRNEIMLLIKAKKSITYGNIFEITSNELVSKTIYDRISERERGALLTAGIYTDSLISSNHKTFIKQTFKSSEIKEFVIIEKDIGESSYFDNMKGGIKYNTLLVGNYRLKTGRGLFSDYSSYFSSSDAPFYSDRAELDATYDEYPAYFGGAFTKGFYSSLLTVFMSGVKHDARIDSSGSVIEIMKYNVHDDSLSISRKDNLSAYCGGFIAREDKQRVNIAFSYTRFSRILLEAESRDIFIFSVFGKKDIFSYDAAYSLFNGFAMSAGLKKEAKDVLFHSGFTMNSEFFNPHAKSYSEKNSCVTAFAEASIRSPVKINEKLSWFSDNESEIENEITVHPLKNIELHFNSKLSDNLIHEAVIVFKGAAKDFLTAKNSYSFKTTGTFTAKADASFMTKFAAISLFGSYCNVAEGDIEAVYGYAIESVYPLRTFREGEGFLFGALLKAAGNERAELNAVVTFDSSEKIRGGISVEIRF